MNYQLTITSDNLEELTRFFAVAPAVVAVAPAPKKAKLVPVVAEEPDVETVEVEDEDESDELKPSEYNYEDDILPAMQAYAKKHGREKALKVLKRFGAANSKALAAEHYEAVMKIIA